MSAAPDAANPSGARQLAWFDKGRLDIADPSADPSNPWFVTGGLLVSELLSGVAQPGNVVLSPANLPVVGDLEQPNAVTYASFAKLEAPSDDLNLNTLRALTAAPRATPNAVIHALLRADGSVLPDGASDAKVIVNGYDDVTGHNIAAPFAAFDAAEGYPATWLLGHALSEPYWVDAAVAGTSKRVLVQLFERRTLTYTPDNPSNWQVESGNVGMHYRMWRGLAQPADPALAGLASLEVGGEELDGAATANGVDPYLLVAIAETHSTPDLLAQPGQAAAQLAQAAAQQSDEHASVAAYFAQSDARNDLTQQPAQLADAAIARRDALRAAYAPSAPATERPIDETGVAASYPAGYNSGWWERSLSWSASWGGAVDGAAANDANGYYCTHAGYAPGERLRVQVNNASIDCTIGSRTTATALAGWPSNSVIQLNDAATNALHLDAGATVHVVPATASKTPDAPTVNEPGVWIGSGQAAYYSPSYDTAWWEWAMRYYNDLGQITPGWQYDPNGNYCVHPNYIPGDRLRLVANGVTLECTIGDTVASQDVANWRARFVVELAWPTFKALGLDGSNQVEVYYLGSAPKPERSAPPAQSTPEPTAEPQPQPTQPPTATPTPEPAPTQAPTDVPSTPTEAPTEAPSTPTEAPVTATEDAAPPPAQDSATPSDTTTPELP
jgi:hypothetical protein